MIVIMIIMVIIMYINYCRWQPEFCVKFHI